MLDRLKAMLVKEFIQVLRDPRMRIVLFVVPVFQVIVFGYAVNTDVRNVATAVVDRDSSAESREVVSRFVSSGYFAVVAANPSDEELRSLLDRGKVRVVLRFDHGFGARLRLGGPAPLQLVVDGTDSNTAGIILGYARAIAGKIAEDAAARRGAAPLPRVELVTRAWYNPNLESRNFYVPAVIAMLILVITMLLSAMAVVREKEVGTMEQVLVTPITRTEFILGKTLPFALIGFTDVAAVTAVATLWFGIPIRGSLSLLFAATALYLLSTLGLGLLISTVSRTQQQAMMSAFFVVFPAMLLSGFAFPIENMPAPVQAVTFANPLRYYMVVLRTIFLKGSGWRLLWPQLAGLALLGTLLMSFAISRFRKTLS